MHILLITKYLHSHKHYVCAYKTYIDFVNIKNMEHSPNHLCINKKKILTNFEISNQAKNRPHLLTVMQ